MEVMENGDEINLGGVYYYNYCVKYKEYPIVRSGTLALAVPDTKDKYILFHLRAELTSDTTEEFDRFFYTEVDLSYNNGLGKVTAKNQILVQDSLHDAVAAVRHGNGRDWWIIIPRGVGREFWEILLTPEGLESPILRTYPASPFTIKIPRLDMPPGHYFVPNEYAWESWGAQAMFSPDGTKYCRGLKGSEFEIYDFNRCTGDMTLLRRVPMMPNPWPDPTYPDYPIGACGLVFSPDSRYLYLNNVLAVYQLDVSPEQIQTAEPLLIELWDRTTEEPPSPFETNFFQMRNAPDGKIYIGSTSTTKSLHVIEEPNKAGKACNFKQHGLKLPRWHFWVINYFPNFRLYDLSGSPCDTLGINGSVDTGEPPEQEDTELHLWPVPVSDVLNVNFGNADPGRWRITDLSGRELLQGAQAKGISSMNISTSMLLTGTYVFSYQTDNSSVSSRLFVVMRQ